MIICDSWIFHGCYFFDLMSIRATLPIPLMDISWNMLTEIELLNGFFCSKLRKRQSSTNSDVEMDTTDAGISKEFQVSSDNWYI